MNIALWTRLEALEAAQAAATAISFDTLVPVTSAHAVRWNFLFKINNPGI
jgi:hypothetical protein